MELALGAFVTIRTSFQFFFYSFVPSSYCVGVRAFLKIIRKIAELMMTGFVEQSLTLPGSAKYLKSFVCKIDAD